MEIDLESNGLQQTFNTNSEDWRSLLKTNSRESSEITIQTARISFLKLKVKVRRNWMK